MNSNARIEEGEVLIPQFQHSVGNVNVEVPYTEQSNGTQKLFALAGPLFDILEKGHVLVIDELDRSLHPLLTQAIIRTFHDSERNRNGASDLVPLTSFSPRKDEALEKGYLAGRYGGIPILEETLETGSRRVQK